MGQNKEQLGKLLDFIETLTKQKGNEWFVDELKCRFQKKEIGIDSFIRLQREKQRKKARYYYQGISEPTLRKQLIENHANMLWYKSIFEIELFFVQVNLQIENMLNYYINNTNAHDKISLNPKQFFKTIGNDKYKIDVDCYSNFFNRSNSKKTEVYKITSMWAKLVYWAIDSDKFPFLQAQFNSFSSIINIRNDQSHAYYKSKSSSAEYWKKQEDDYAFAFIYAILQIIRNSIL